jgi:hypothetical protein
MKSRARDLKTSSSTRHRPQDPEAPDPTPADDPKTTDRDEPETHRTPPPNTSPRRRSSDPETWILDRDTPKGAPLSDPRSRTPAPRGTLANRIENPPLLRPEGRQRVESSKDHCDTQNFKELRTPAMNRALRQALHRKPTSRHRLRRAGVLPSICQGAPRPERLSRSPSLADPCRPVSRRIQAGASLRGQARPRALIVLS